MSYKDLSDKDKTRIEDLANSYFRSNKKDLLRKCKEEKNHFEPDQSILMNPDQWSSSNWRWFFFKSELWL